MKSQRTDGFNAGIKAGSTASTAQSIKLESIVRKSVLTSIQDAGLMGEVEWISGYSRQVVGEKLGTHLDVVGCYPDGGIFIRKGSLEPILVVEAKKQGPAGNAIERWYKNHALINRLGSPVYLTFCSGEGFFDGNTAERTLNLAMALSGSSSISEWNTEQSTRDWFYRFRTAEEAEMVIPNVITSALKKSNKSTTKEKNG